MRVLVEPRILSASTNGLSIKVAATSSPGTTIHTAHATSLDRIWLSVYNGHTDPVELTIQFGGTSSPDNDIKETIPAKSGEILVVAGRLLTNSLVVRAYAGTTNVLTISGEVERATVT